MASWREMLEDAKNDVRHELAGTDAREARDEMYRIVDDMVDAALPVYNADITDMVIDANLAGVEPENPPSEVTVANVGLAVLREELQNKLYAYAEQFIEDSEVCADGHLIDEDEATSECEHCGDTYCSDRSHGRKCTVCGADTCASCRALVSNYGTWVCDDCDERLTEEDNEKAEADEAK